MPRSYNLKKRAERQDETRLRIVEAAVELHEAVGAMKTTISAIAERAGVERATVYRHFPDERTLLQACTSHYFEQNQPPGPDCWAEIVIPEERLRAGLAQIYAYHRRTEKMLARAATDLPQVPVLQEVLAPMFEHWEMVTNTLVDGWKSEAERPGTFWVLLAAAIGHAISFQTWQSLVREQGLEDAQAVELMVGMVRCAARGTM